jgi:uncharacterized protein
MLRYLIFLFLPFAIQAQIVTDYYPNGNKKFLGKKVDGIEDSTWMFWYENGQISAIIHYDMGEIDGKFEYFGSNGLLSQRGFQKDGLPYDTLSNFYPHGPIRDQTVFVNGSKNGLYREWYPEGGLRLSVPYIDNLIEGEKLFYYESGKLCYSKSYRKGADNGPTIYYDPSGKKLWEGIFADGVREGLCKSYHKNGNIESTGRFSNDLMEGEWIYYNESGKIIKREFYEKGVLTGTKSR